MKLRSVFLAVSGIVIAACSSAESTTTPEAEPETVGTVQQGVIVEEYSPYLDTTGGAAIQTYTSQFGPQWAPNPIDIPHQTRPGICGLVDLVGGFRGGNGTGSNQGASAYITVVPDPVNPTGNPGGRFQLVVSRDALSLGRPKARMRCVSLSSFSNTTRINGELSYTGLAGKIQGPPLGPDELGVQAGTGSDLKVWGGVGGFVGNATTATSPDGSFVAKYWNANLSGGPLFYGESTYYDHQFFNFVQNYWHKFSLFSSCANVPSGTINPCRTRSYGWSYSKFNAAYPGGDSLWLHSGPAAEIVNSNTGAANPNIVYSTIGVGTLATQFCFISGIARKWDTADSSAAIHLDPNDTSRTVLHTGGQYTQASAHCVPFAQ